MALPLPSSITLDHHQLRPHNGLCDVKLEKASLTLLYCFTCRKGGLHYINSRVAGVKRTEKAETKRDSLK